MMDSFSDCKIFNEAAKRSLETGAFMIDGQNVTDIPVDLLAISAGQGKSRSDFGGINYSKARVAKDTTISFDDTKNTSQWWQIEPITKISLSRNNISRIPKEIIEDSHETLLHLDLSYNQLTTLPDRLHYCRNLKYLNVSRNKLDSMVSIPNSVVVLHLSDNELKSLPDSLFQQHEQASLVELRANRNKLHSMPKCFKYLSLLQVLELKGNLLTSQCIRFITSCVDLKEIDISHNRIEYLPDDIGALTRLRRLDARENRLQCLPSSLSHIAELCELYCGMNKLTHLQDDFVWEQLMKLKTLDISSNDINVLPDSISKLPAIAVLDISNNDIARLPDCFGKLQTLRKLVLHGNPIRSIRRELLENETTELMKYFADKLERNKIFGEESHEETSSKSQSMSKITIAPCNGRIIHTNDKSLMTMPSIHQFADCLTHIHLQDNRIALDEDDCNAICSLPYLEELNLSNNLILSWPFNARCSTFRNENLTLLNMSLNKMELPDPNDQSLHLHTLFPKLQHLDLSNCILNQKHIDLDISELTHLQELVLESCALASFPVSLLKMGSLLRLSLRCNSIQKIPDEIVRLTSLRSLDVSNNNLSHLPFAIGLMSDSLRTLLVDGNPLRTIRRTIIEKGTTALLEYLRNKIPEK